MKKRYNWHLETFELFLISAQERTAIPPYSWTPAEEGIDEEKVRF
jgi:hypothetical protein